MLFDAIAIIDWSGRGKPSAAYPVPDAIHAACLSPEGMERRYFPTRAAACAWMEALARDCLGQDRRLLLGLDFPFGYPRGAALRIAGREGAAALWSALASMIEDDRANRSNRFEVAARINAAFQGEGPFWGVPAQAARPDLLATRRKPWPDALIPEKRLAETRARGAKSVWQLGGAGAVGSQALLGIPRLDALRRTPDLAPHVAVWPFDTGFAPPRRPICLAEIYPSLLGPALDAGQQAWEIRDAAQVRLLAEHFAALDLDGALAPLFARPEGLSDEEAGIAAREEGWILGLR